MGEVRFAILRHAVQILVTDETRAAKVQGELRIYIDTPVPIASIDVWLVGQSECMLDLAQLPFLNAVRLSR